jgi:hypothetical protein
MAERLARRKAAQNAAANPQANQALRYGVTNPPAVQPEPKKQGGFGGGWGPNIMNALNSIVSLTPPMLVANGISKAKNLATGNGDWTEPLKTVAAIPRSFQSTGSNLIDLLPYVDTKEPGINYVNDWNQGHGITTGIEDAMNIAAIYGGAKAGINSFPSIKSGLAEELARFQAGNDAGVIGRGERPKLQTFGPRADLPQPPARIERPQINLTGQPIPRMTADYYNQLRGPMNEIRGFGDIGKPFSEGISGIIKSSVDNANLPRPGAGSVPMGADAMERYINQLTSKLDSVPDWMKPPAEPKPLTDPFADPNYQPPQSREIPMSPRRAEINATPRTGQNPVWPKDWDQVDLTKELDLTKKFDNPNQLDNVAPEIRNKWSAQQAFKEKLIKQINEGDLYSFPKDFFPPGANTPAQQIRWLEVSSLKDLLGNPVLANEYIDLMRLFGQ